MMKVLPELLNRECDWYCSSFEIYLFQKLRNYNFFRLRLKLCAFSNDLSSNNLRSLHADKYHDLHHPSRVLLSANVADIPSGYIGK